MCACSTNKKRAYNSVSGNKGSINSCLYHICKRMWYVTGVMGGSYGRRKILYSEEEGATRGITKGS